MTDAAEVDVKHKNQNLDQYLTFYLDTEEYGVDILSVVEIRGWEEPTPLPAAHPYVKGIINMRGTIVPVIDLRDRFKLPPKEITALTVIIVLQVEKNGKKRIMGIVADAVSDVYNIDSQSVQEAPEDASRISNLYIKGLVNVDNKMVILLEGDALLDLSIDTDRHIQQVVSSQNGADESAPSEQVETENSTDDDAGSA